MASNLVKRYTDYRIRNEQIKARQRREREKELEPFLIDIGKSVDEDRANGRSVPELAALIDNKNRNFLYSALRKYRASMPEFVEPDTVPEFEAEPTASMIEYELQPTGNYWVRIVESSDDADSYYFTIDNGTVVDYPEGIAERYGKPFLKKLISEVERGAAQNT
jgi:hypothetical protein